MPLSLWAPSAPAAWEEVALAAAQRTRALPPARNQEGGRSSPACREEGLGLGLELRGLWGHQPAPLWPALAGFGSVFGRSLSGPELDFSGLLSVRVAENSTQQARAGSRESTPLQESHRCWRKARPAVEPQPEVANLPAKGKVGAKKVLTWSCCKTINSPFVLGQDPLNLVNLLAEPSKPSVDPECCVSGSHSPRLRFSVGHHWHFPCSCFIGHSHHVLNASGAPLPRFCNSKPCPAHFQGPLRAGATL